MVLESTGGKMEEVILEIMKTIKSMDMVCIVGPTEENMMETGKTENSMVKVNIIKQIAASEWEFGIMVADSIGLMSNLKIVVDA